jgi:hypothetical protein
MASEPHDRCPWFIDLGPGHVIVVTEIVRHEPPPHLKDRPLPSLPEGPLPVRYRPRHRRGRRKGGQS